MVLEREGDFVVDSHEYFDEVRLEWLYCLFCLVAAVIVGGYQLVLHVISFDALFECHRCFVVELVVF